MNEKSFTQGSILPLLLRFAGPVLLALCLQAMYGAVDLWMVGTFGTAADVSAVSTGSLLMQTMTYIITGLAMGTTIQLGQCLGQNRPQEAGRIVGGAIALFACVGILFTVLLVLSAHPLATVMEAPADALQKTIDYLKICGSGFLFITAYNVLGSIFRGMGDSKTPLLAVFIACILNVIGDYIFVAQFHMAAAGAALATVLAQAASVLLCLLVIIKRGLPFPFARKNIWFHKDILSKTLRLGFPIALQDGLVSLSFLVIIAIINSLGVIASAGVGVAEKLCMFIMLLPSAYMQSLSAFVAQNIGAGQISRAKKAMVYAMGTSLICGFLIFYVSFFHGNLLAEFFTSDTLVIAAAANYLKAYAIDTLLVSFLFCFIGYFNGCGHTTFVMFQGILGAFCVRIPVSYAMSKLMPVSLFRVGLATPASTVVQIVLCTLFFLYLIKKEKTCSE